LLEFLASEEGPKNIPDVDFVPEVIESMQSVPLWYNRYYYNTESILKGLYEKPKSRAQEVMDIERELLKKYEDPKLVTKPEELDKRGGAFYSKIAVDIVDSIVNDTGGEHIINVHNNGAIPGLPDDAVVETVAYVGKNGAKTRPTDPLEPSARALVQQAKAYEELTIEAALNQSWGAAFRAIITNPIGPRAEKAKKVLDDLLATNRLEYK
jgi:6-phospho-beta-glucosidase